LSGISARRGQLPKRQAFAWLILDANRCEAVLVMRRAIAPLFSAMQPAGQDPETRLAFEWSHYRSVRGRMSALLDNFIAGLGADRSME
jgi:hypothetical protein